jgi:hypothetical protein
MVFENQSDRAKGGIMRRLARWDAPAGLNAVPDKATNRSGQFDAAVVDELTAFSAEQRIAGLKAMANRVFNAAAIGSFLIAKDTTAVVNLLIENPERFGEARLELARALEEAQCLLTVIDFAERRLAAGLAQVANRKMATRNRRSDFETNA